MKTQKLLRDLTLWTGTLIMSLALGATLYHMMTIVPAWIKNLPDSMIEFSKTNIELAGFWDSPVLYFGPLLLIVSLVLSWKTPRRNWILAYLVIYIITMVVTIVYFLPKLAIMGVYPPDAIPTEDLSLLTRTVKEWVFADQIRFYADMLPSFFLLLKAVSLPLPGDK